MGFTLSPCRGTCNSNGDTYIFPVSELNRAEERPREHTVGCPACGVSWVGTAREVRIATGNLRSEARELVASEQRSKADAVRAKYEAHMASQRKGGTNG